MNAYQIIETIRQPYHSSRSFWQAADSRPEDALAIVTALVDAGLCTDHRIGKASLEYRVLQYTNDVFDSYENPTEEDVAAEIAWRLGLVTHEEASEYSGKDVAA